MSIGISASAERSNRRPCCRMDASARSATSEVYPGSMSRTDGPSKIERTIDAAERTTAIGRQALQGHSFLIVPQGPEADCTVDCGSHEIGLPGSRKRRGCRLTGRRSKDGGRSHPTDSRGAIPGPGALTSPMLRQPFGHSMPGMPSEAFSSFQGGLPCPVLGSTLPDCGRPQM